MTLNFNKKVFNLGGNLSAPPLQYYEKGFSLGGDNYAPTWQDIIISGNTALTLVNAKADGLNYVKLYGKTIQESVTLPTGYTRLEYLQSNGNQYINTYIRALQRRALQIDFQYLTTPNATSYVGGEVMKGSGTSLTSMMTIGAYGSNKIVVRFADSAINTNIDCGTDRHVVKVAEETWEVDGVTGTFTSSGTISSSAYNIYLFGANRVNALFGSDPVRIFNAKIWDTDELRQDWYPCRRDSDGTLGMYDIVNDTFRTNAGTGTFTAGADYAPTPTENARIICNNGQIRKKNNLPAGYTQLVSITGATNRACFDTGVSGNNDNLRIKWKAQKETFVNYSPFFGNYRNESYNTTRSLNTAVSKGIIATINRMASGSVNTNGVGPLELHEYEVYKEDGKSVLVVDGNIVDRIANASGTANDTNIGFNSSAVLTAKSGASTTNTTFYYMQIYDGDTLIRNYVPVKNSNNVAGMYDTVNDTFKPAMFDVPFTAGDVDESAYGVYTDGTVETVKDSLDNTATAEMLLAVSDNVRDVQEVLTGEITRNVGVKVFNGTENWLWQSTNDRFFCDIGMKIFGNRTCPLYCTHYQAITDGRSFADVPNYSVYGASTTNNVYLHDSRFTDASSLKAYLREQYKAGTPVILIFPLATPTTATVTGQTLTTQRGTNVIEITQASIDGLPLEVSYKAGVTVTVEEVENANLSNEVTVTIGE